MKKILIFISVLLLGANVVFAQDAALIKQCRELLDVYGTTSTYKATITSMLDSMRNQGMEIDEAKCAKLVKALTEDEGFERFLDNCAKVYANHFTAKEVKKAISFYKSDVGKKFVSEGPVMAKEIMPLAMEWSQSLLPKLLEALGSE